MNRKRVQRRHRGAVEDYGGGVSISQILGGVKMLEEVKVILKSLDIKICDDDGNMRVVYDILKDLSVKWDEMDKEAKDNLLDNFKKKD